MEGYANTCCYSIDYWNCCRLPVVTKRFYNKKVSSDLSPSLVAKGEGFYKKNCIACHGEKGAGENPADIYAIDEKGNYIAPPLNESAHARHHTDEQLMEMILEGSSRNPRMIAWKKKVYQ